MCPGRRHDLVGVQPWAVAGMQVLAWAMGWWGAPNRQMGTQFRFSPLPPLLGEKQAGPSVYLADPQAPPVRGD